ncbi:MAG: hypothetical protein C0483_23935 [Pirellula sp.]|nr:hypothetical protein [Pirellula sp.]
MAAVMLEELRRLIAHQYEAAFCVLAHCAARCPDALWNAPVAKYPFNQVLFHTLFFADLYLGVDEESLSRQPFHLENQELFADYEQLADREPLALYTREQIALYLDFCRRKAATTLDEETEPSLCAPALHPGRNFSRAELHVYNIRHIQHHGAQLTLRLRLDSDVDIRWIGSGWREPNSSP